jgi:predicted nucleotidyltransferase
LRVTVPAADPVVDRLGNALRDSGEVRLAFLFGSRARGRADSDFDIAVLLDTDAADLEGLASWATTKLDAEP